MTTRTMEIKSWRINKMFKFLFWTAIYLGLVVIGGTAGAGWAIVAGLGVLYTVGTIFKRKVEDQREGRCDVEDE